MHKQYLLTLLRVALVYVQVVLAQLTSLSMGSVNNLGQLWNAPANAGALLPFQHGSVWHLGFKLCMSPPSSCP